MPAQEAFARRGGGGGAPMGAEGDLCSLPRKRKLVGVLHYNGKILFSWNGGAK